MHDLKDRKCVPCEGGTPPLSQEEVTGYLTRVYGWSLSRGGGEISKTFRFHDFAGALAFANRIGEIAEREGHHPDLTVSWGKVGVTLSTHSIGGLSENDFILAAKIDVLTGPVA